MRCLYLALTNLLALIAFATYQRARFYYHLGWMYSGAYAAKKLGVEIAFGSIFVGPAAFPNFTRSMFIQKPQEISQHNVC
jgi:hypothetical protein